MDKHYWETFYENQNLVLKQSKFAEYVVDNYTKNRKILIELGCGNGRDAVFFAKEHLNVFAVDQVFSEIQFLSGRFSQLQNLTFKCADFTQLDNSQTFDIIYSRFTLHSINARQELNVLSWAYQNLNRNGILCVEVRGQKNEIYKFGEAIIDEPDAFIYNNHYRRFLNFDKFTNTLKEIGFLLEYASEAKGFAPFNDADETFIRVIAKKGK